MNNLSNTQSFHVTKSHSNSHYTPETKLNHHTMETLRQRSIRSTFILLFLLSHLRPLLAQEEDAEHMGGGHHHGGSTETWTSGAATNEPLDRTLWLHIFFMSTAFFIYPIGMVLGLARSRWHVPTVLVASGLFTLGYFLGHAHEGRSFEPHNAHRGFANVVVWTVFFQVLAGMYLKLHWTHGIHSGIRRIVVATHGCAGVMIPLLGYTQMVLGVIASVGFCYGGEWLIPFFIFRYCSAHDL